MDPNDIGSSPNTPANEPPQDSSGASLGVPDDHNEAAALIRKKIDELYAVEPNAKQEATEAEEIPAKTRSKHQQFMHELSTSGKSLAQIQTEWHNYYTALPDNEKHAVWHEFYAEHNQTRLAAPSPASPQTTNPFLAQQQTGNKVVSGSIEPEPTPVAPKRRSGTRSVTQIKRQLLGTVEKRQKLKAKQHAQSLVFGLGLGAFVILILLFGFFNERFLAPLITPSRHVSATPIITDPNSTTTDNAKPEVIIPKINVEIPVVYDEPSIADNAVEAALEHGVLHYATTPSPGQQGNVVIFGHSSNNIFNHGQYKFAFVLLSRLDNGDTFYLTKDGKRYAYQVYDKKIVKPTDVAVMGDAAKPNSATLITCDPPGTSLNRLVVTGQQISPDPNTNVASTAIKTASQPKIVPSNAPSLWNRLTSWLSS